MFPLVLAIAFAFFSFIASAFIILHIIIPILPPHPLSRRVSPVEFGLSAFRTLSSANQIHVWLASLDLIALAFFLWEIVVEATGGASGFASAADPVSSTKYSVFLTIRQIFLLVVTGITLLHIRLGCPVSFGKSHWTVWAPSLAFILTSATLSGVISGAGINTLFYGLIAYNSAIVIASVAVFSCLVSTSLAINRKLNAIDAKINTCSPIREEKPRPSFAIHDIEALRGGGSWISSNSSASSRHSPLSAWSFSTHQTTSGSSPNHGRPMLGGRHLVPAKVSYRVGNFCEGIPPVPPLSSTYCRISRTAGTMALGERDPFRRDIPSFASVHPRVRLGSQTSWLTSASGSCAPMSAWSFSTPAPSFYSASMRDICIPSGTVSRFSRSNKAVSGNAQDLGGYSYASSEVEKVSTVPDMDFDVSINRYVGWFFLILVPYAFSLPYLIIASQEHSPPFIVSTLFMLSITLSSPILAFNVLFKCHFPIPTGPFDVSTYLPPDLREPKDNLTLPHRSHEYKHSMRTGLTVVEDGRSGDVWIAKGDAVDGKGKLGRALEVLNPHPKLSVIPPQEAPQLPPLSPPLPIQDKDSLPMSDYNSSETGAQLSHRRSEPSRSSSREEDSIVASRIMTAHRHYSALARTIVIPGTSHGKEEGKSSDMITTHLGRPRARSMSLVCGPVVPTPSNSTFKLIPTPPPRTHHSLGLEKDGGDHSPTSMNADFRMAIERKATQIWYSDAPNNVRLSWRNIVFGASLIPDAFPHHIPLKIEPEKVRLVRSATLKLHLNIPQVNSVRASLLGKKNFVSVASSATLVDVTEDNSGCGPLAESTPHHTFTEKNARTLPPPLRLEKPIRTRLSIVCIKSEDTDKADVMPPGTESTTASAMAPIAQCSSQALEPQISKASKLRSMISNVSLLVSGDKSDPPEAGVRPLMLLRATTPNTTSLIFDKSGSRTQ